MTTVPSLAVVVLDDGHSAAVDGLAMTVALFGRGRFQLIYVNDPPSVRSAAARAAAGVVIVDVDRDPNPKQTLSELTDGALPVVVLTDGRDETVAEHARNVGVAACLASSLPAHQILSCLSTMAVRSGK